MNKLRILDNVSLHNCHRAVYSIFEARNDRIKNVSDTRIRLSRVSGFSQFAAPEYCDKKIHPTLKSLETTPIGGTKFVFVRSEQIIPFFVSSGKKYGGIFCQKTSVLATVSCQNYFNRTNVRHYSDASANVAPVPHMQLDGFLKTLSESAPVEFSQNALIWLHSTTGLPWWATIILATWSVRAFFTLPLALHQHYIFAKYHNLTDELNEIAGTLKLKTNYAIHQYKWSERQANAVFARSLKKERQKLIERDNCHPMKSVVLVMVQIPMWVILSTSLRNMCYMLPRPTESAFLTYIELTKGGFGWVMDLTMPDSTFAIPLALGLINLTIIEIQNLMRLSEPTKVQKYLMNFCRITSVGMIVLASYVPSAMSLYWMSSSAFGVAQNFILMSPRIRRLARIPETDVELEEPYKHIHANLRRRIGLKDDAQPKNGKKFVNMSKNPIKAR